MSDYLLPTALQDTNNIALEECIKLAFDIDMKKFMIYPVEGVSESLFPVLAKENCVMGWEGWNLCSTDSEKRSLIINSFTKHAVKGSILSLKSVLDDFKVDAVIQEFQEYGGRPAHYIVKFLGIYEQSLTDDFKSAILKIISLYAPASRILDYINYFLCSKGMIYAGTYIKISEKTVIGTKEVIL